MPGSAARVHDRITKNHGLVAYSDASWHDSDELALSPSTVILTHLDEAVDLVWMEASLSLAVVVEKTCFVNLPVATIQQLDGSTPTALRLEWDSFHAKSVAYVGWGGGASSSDSLEVPAALAEALNLRPPRRLRVRAVCLPIAASVTLEPQSSADWEIVQREAKQLEGQILMQTLIVGKYQQLPLWVNNTEIILLRVTESCPATPAVRLCAGTELQACDERGSSRKIISDLPPCPSLLSNAGAFACHIWRVGRSPPLPPIPKDLLGAVACASWPPLVWAKPLLRMGNWRWVCGTIA